MILLALSLSSRLSASMSTSKLLLFECFNLTHLAFGEVSQIFLFAIISFFIFEGSVYGYVFEDAV